MEVGGSKIFSEVEGGLEVLLGGWQPRKFVVGEEKSERLGTRIPGATTFIGLQKRPVRWCFRR